MDTYVVEGTRRSLTECKFMHNHGRHSTDNPVCQNELSICLIEQPAPVEFDDGPDSKCTSCGDLGYIEDETCSFPPCTGKMVLL